MAARQAAEALPASLRRELADRTGLDVGALRPIATIAARHSELVEWATPPGELSGSLLVKRIVRMRDPERARARLLREFEALTSLARDLDPELARSVPAALAVAPGDLALAMGRLRGTPLHRLVRRDANRLAGWLRWPRIRDTAYAVGAWLARFQQATRSEPVCHDHEAFIAGVGRTLDRVAGEHRSHGLVASLLDDAAAASRALAGSSLPAAARHGDFLPQNVLVDGRRIAIVDFENFEARNVVYEDAGTFLGYLAMLETRPAYSRRALRAARAGFLAGSGMDGDARAVRLYEFKGALTVAADSPGQAGRRRLHRLATLCRELGP